MLLGDEIVEWNGVCLRNQRDDTVQKIISHWSGEIEITVRLDKQPYKLARHKKTRYIYILVTVTRKCYYLV